MKDRILSICIPVVYVIICLLVAFLPPLLFSGSENDAQLKAEIESKVVLGILPSNAIIIEDLGTPIVSVGNTPRNTPRNRWYIVEIEIEGKKTKFLFNWYYGSHGVIHNNFSMLDQSPENKP